MYRFDEQKGILYTGKLDVVPEFKGYEPSDHYKDFMRYLYTDPKGDNKIVCLQNDLKILANEILVRLNNSSRPEANTPYFRFQVTSIKQHDKNSSFGDSEACVIRGKFLYAGIESEEMDIIRLPQMTRSGTIYEKGQEYAIACTSEPSKYLTYNGRDAMSIVAKAKKFDINIPASKKPSMVINRKKVTLQDAIFLLNKQLKLAREEYEVTKDKHLRALGGSDVTYRDEIYNIPPVDLWKLFEEIETPDNVKYCYDSLGQSDIGGVTIRQWREEYGEKVSDHNAIMKYPKVFCEIFGMIDGYGTNGVDPSTLEDVRRQINELLCIDRGEGRILSRDVIDSNHNVIAEEGSIVSKDLIAKFNACRINCYYVKSNPVFQPGSELAVAIPIGGIKEDTYIPHAVRHQVPSSYMDENFITTARIDFPLDALMVIPDRTVITRELLRFINNAEIFDVQRVIVAKDQVGYKTLLDNTNTKSTGWDLKASNTRVPIIKNKYAKGSEIGDVHYLLFEEEILGNRHFKNGDEWVFVSEDGRVAPESPYLTIFDVFGLLSMTYRLKNAQYIDRVSDKDLGVRKKFCLFGDHIHDAIVKKSKIFGSQFYRNRIVLRNTKDDFIFRMYFDIIGHLGSRGKKVSMLADVTNPAAYASFTNRVNTIVADSNAATNSMRLLSMGYYGRLCPYETPQSSKLGLTNTKAFRSKIEGNEILTPYFKVVHIGGSHKIMLNKKYWLTIQEEEKYRIADLLSLDFDNSGNISNKGLVLARVPATNSLEKMEVQNIDISLVEYVNCYADQTLSCTATTIPFVGSNDAVRDSYGLAMARQSRSLVNREVPTIFTYGNFDIVRMNDKFMLVAEEDGIVTDVMVSNQSFGRYTQKLIITVMYYNPIREKYELEDELSPDAYNNMEVRYEYPLYEYNHQSVIIRKAEVKPNQEVRKGDLLVSSNFTKDGLMTTTVNAFVGICPAGWNYEDGVFMSSSLGKRLTSYGHNKDDIKVSSKTVIHAKNWPRYHYTNVSRLVEWSKPDVYGNKFSSSDHIKGFLVDFKQDLKAKRCNSNSPSKTYSAHAISFNKLVPGDKTANRHGNKGVVPKIVEEEDMFYLSNGQTIDLLYNPPGIGSRMNLGQVKEIHVGLALYVLGMKMGVQSFNETEWDEMTLLLEYAWDCANNGVDYANSQAKYNIYPQSMKDYVKRNENMIKMWKGVFEKDGTAYLYDPKTGKRKHRRVVVGINSVYKLVQEVDEKINARGGMIAGSAYTKSSARPVKGAKVNGGQTIGHMELQALASHGSTEFIKEILHWRGDNHYERQIKVAKTVGTYDTLLPSHVEAMETIKPRRATEEFLSTLKALGLEVIIEEPNCYLPDNTRDTNDKKILYSTSAILGTSKPKITREQVEKEEEFVSQNSEIIDAYEFE